MTPTKVWRLAVRGSWFVVAFFDVVEVGLVPETISCRCCPCVGGQGGQEVKENPEP